MRIENEIVTNALYFKKEYHNTKQSITNDIDEQKKNRWTNEDYQKILNEIIKTKGCEIIKVRDEYTLLKQIKDIPKQGRKECKNGTQIQNLRTTQNLPKAVNKRSEPTGVNYTYGMQNDKITPFVKPDGFLYGNLGSFLSSVLSDVDDDFVCELKSFQELRLDAPSINIGFDTEFQNSDEGRFLLSLQMSLIINKKLFRYFFLVKPDFQKITKDGGLVCHKRCFSDILNDLKNSYIIDLPKIRNKDIVYKNFENKKYLDFKTMKDFVIPITLICHTGKADITVFRRSKYDIDLLRHVSEIQGGLISLKDIKMCAEADDNRNYYWMINLSIRDTLGLTPADNKSLKILGDIIENKKIVISEDCIKNMSSFALQDPGGFYEYGMNDADIVILFTSAVFLNNHKLPVTLSSCAARAIYKNIKEYFGIISDEDYNKIYRGLETLKEDIKIKKDVCLKFLRATRLVPRRDCPDAGLISNYFEEAFTGGFNASFYLGWISEKTYDFDLKQAYVTAMASIIDIDWTKDVRDFNRHSELRLEDIVHPLNPCVAIGDFEFPDDCYCPNIPVETGAGFKIYPKQGKNVYMCGPDMWLALHLGAKITIHRGFTIAVLRKTDGEPSKCLAYAMTNIVQDRAKAQKLYPEKVLIEQTTKAIGNYGYGKISQNVSPKTRYNAKLLGREDSEPSIVTSPYHASYTTALVRCMLIGCINELHNLGYKVYSVTTDGFITNAPEDVIQRLKAYGFTDIFQDSRFTLNQSTENIPENKVWAKKHFNDAFLNITTRGNVAVNKEGVLAHNSFITGKDKGSLADREAYIFAVLAREGKVKCPTKTWSEFSNLVEKKHDFEVKEIIRELSMNFDYKRCPIIETCKDVDISYISTDGKYNIKTTIAEFDTKPFKDIEEFLKYRKSIINESVKVKEDLERIETKSTAEYKGYIGKDLKRKILLSIIMGFKQGLYKISALEGLKQSKAVETVNNWGISQITINDWKNCSKAHLQKNMLPFEMVKDTLNKINGY